jgi:hypothetical protein
MTQAGKGDKRRPTDQKRFEEKYLKINWGKSHGNADSEKKVKINENNA